MVLDELLRNVFVMVYFVSLAYYSLNFLGEIIKITKRPTLREFLRMVLLFLVGFIPIINTVLCYMLIKDWRKR